MAESLTTRHPELVSGYGQLQAAIGQAQAVTYTLKQVQGDGHEGVAWL